MARAKAAAKGGKKGGSKPKAKGKKGPAAQEAKAAAPDLAQPKVGAGQARKVITQAVLKEILKTDARVREKNSANSGELGKLVRDTVDKFGTNRTALQTIRRIYRMSPEQLADFLDDFDHMLDISGLEAKAEGVQRLPLAGGQNGQPDEGGEEDDDAAEETPPAGDPPGQQEPLKAGGGTVVSPPQFGRRQAAEGSTEAPAAAAGGLKH